MTERDRADGAASGFSCPQCGGSLWARSDGDELAFECRIGDRFEAVELWIEHSLRRNLALKAAENALAENAALARLIAAWAVERGESGTATRLEQEAAEEERLRNQVRAMLQGLPEPASRPDGNARREGMAR